VAQPPTEIYSHSGRKIYTSELTWLVSRIVDVVPTFAFWFLLGDVLENYDAWVLSRIWPVKRPSHQQ